jgi:hypothetical protein
MSAVGTLEATPLTTLALSLLPLSLLLGHGPATETEIASEADNGAVTAGRKNGTNSEETLLLRTCLLLLLMLSTTRFLCYGSAGLTRFVAKLVGPTNSSPLPSLLPMLWRWQQRQVPSLLHARRAQHAIVAAGWVAHAFAACCEVSLIDRPSQSERPMTLAVEGGGDGFRLARATSLSAVPSANVCIHTYV